MTISSHYDLVIVGGGINGCALALAAARRGLRTLLLEKLDFGAGTTSRSTRLIHGGLRYLESFQFSLVRESLRDREALLRGFPGQVAPQPFLLPTYKSDTRPAWYLGVGFALYRLLASGGSLPGHRRLDASETLRLLPGLDPVGLTGSFEYYDCQAMYPERLALEMALRAAEAGADIRNHARVTGFLTVGSRVAGVRVESPDGDREIRARLVVNATGVWTDRLLAPLRAAAAPPLVSLVNGAHIVVPEIPGGPRHAVYREARADGRPFFIIPWRGLHLIGTTETPFHGDPDRALPGEREIEYLVREAGDLFPGAGIRRESVLYSYAGSRPLLRSDSANLNRASRSHRVIDHGQTDGKEGLLTMAGGKLTTSPTFARHTLRAVERKLGLAPVREPPSPAETDTKDIPPRLASVYGPRSAEVLRYLEQSPDRMLPLAPGCETTRGEILFAVEREGARTLGDILLRRTGLAFDPGYQTAWAQRAAAISSPVLGWDDSRVASEVSSYETELSSTLALSPR